ncbi:LOW QUALITY PROTEIN: vomeronasal type-1 receptor 90-like [Camelus ferus]|uniref:Vomeronasal type-1 receptor n=1 Tax=Camelus ferus TaxID=419612 RepID=A0A8B8S396_CAMFR|nr:LOW QUALITY PROTEIN: vomeronasal type-1 receptor 90-like [Camelus ferus]
MAYEEPGLPGDLSSKTHANAFLLFFHVFSLSLDCRPKPCDLITCHLAFIHIVMLLTVLWLSPRLFESLHFQNDLKCKVFFFVNRVTRGLSIGTTCLLSVFQAITISPNTSWFVRFKQKSTSCIIHVFFFLWPLNLSLSSNLIFSTVASYNLTQANLLNVSKYCSLSAKDSIIRRLFFILTIFRDASFVGIMLLASVYMVILLFRHHRRSQHLHSTHLSPRASPEKKATRTILLLVIFFVVMYCVTFITSFSSVLLWAYDPVFLGILRLVINAYAVVSPLVLPSSDKRVTNILLNMQGSATDL